MKIRNEVLNEKVDISYSTDEHVLEKAHKEDAGWDIKAQVSSDVVLKPGERKSIGTGIRFSLPPNVEAQVRSRSGLSINFGVIVLNSPGTIDPGYRGEVKILLANLGDKDFIIKNGDRIAQIIYSQLIDIELNKKEKDELYKEEASLLDRGEKGLGSTGIRKTKKLRRAESLPKKINMKKQAQD